MAVRNRKWNSHKSQPHRNLYTKFLFEIYEISVGLTFVRISFSISRFHIEIIAVASWLLRISTLEHRKHGREKINEILGAFRAEKCHAYNCVNRRDEAHEREGVDHGRHWQRFEKKKKWRLQLRKLLKHLSAKALLVGGTGKNSQKNLKGRSYGRWID